MNIQQLSNHYFVRVLDQSDIDMIYNMCCKNDIYYQYHPPFVTNESILEDMLDLPPGKTYEDKFYVGFFDGDVLVAVMDLVLGYHTEKVAFIGFFMMNVDYQKQGIGTAIVEQVLAYLKSLGYQKVRLAVDKGNPQSNYFWTKNKFVTIKVNQYILKERRIKDVLLETERLILRPWMEADAEDLFQYASSPMVGPAAGWPAHTSVEESRQIIRDVLSAPEIYAIVLKETGQAIGSIGLKYGQATDLTEVLDECELGYWIGVPFWGLGLMPEAVKEMLRFAFCELDMKKVWCAYYDGNEKSKRVQEKCGFIYAWTTEDVEVPLMKETRIGHVNAMTREQWKNKERSYDFYQH